MRVLVSLIVFVAFTAWVIGYFYFHMGGIFHIFLVISAVALFLTVFGGESLYQTDDRWPEE